MKRFVIVLLLPKIIEDYINSIREHFEPGISNKIPPHLSISYPFFYDKPKEELFDKIQANIKLITVASISLTSLGTFPKEGQGNILYATVHPREALEKTYEEVREKVIPEVIIDTSSFPDATIPNYVPHITLSMKGNLVNDNWLKRKLAPLFGERSFTLDTLALFSNARGADYWILEKKFLLGNGV